MKKRKNPGWRRESDRHALSRRGIRTTEHMSRGRVKNDVLQNREVQMRVKEVIDEIKGAQKSWVDLDWTAPVHEIVIADDGEEIDIQMDAGSGVSPRNVAMSGRKEFRRYNPSERRRIDRAYERVKEKVIEYRKEVEDSAQAAMDEGNDAIKYLKEGNFEYALDSLEMASAIEREYGDCPTWSIPLSSLETFIEDMEDEQ